MTTTIHTVVENPSVFKVLEKNLNQMEKNELKDFIAVYLYQVLAKLLRLVPEFTNHNLILIAEGEYFDTMDEEFKSRFFKSLLSIQNIDDRFIVDWNNIRIINKNEKKLQDFVLYKDSLNNQNNDKGFVSLNLGSNGVNLIGSDPSSTASSTDSNSYSSSIDNMFNNNEDNSKTSIQIKKGDSKENIYSKNIEVVGFNNIEDTFLNAINSGSRRYNYINPQFKSIANSKEEIEEQILKKAKNKPENNSPKIKLTYSDIVNDPTILKLTNYISENNLIDNYINNSVDNFRFQQKDLKNITIKKKILNVTLDKHHIEIPPKKIKDNIKTSIEKLKNKIKANPCFNKGYYDKELNFAGSGNFDSCIEYIKININASVQFSNDTIFRKSSEKNLFSVTLGKDYKNFKFLFYEKDFKDIDGNVYKYKEMMNFINFKNKTREFCAQQYSYIIAEYDKFKVKNLSKMCFDLTYLTVLLSSKLSDKDLVVIKAHNQMNTEKKSEKNPWTILTDKNNLTILTLFGFSLFFMIIVFTCSDFLIKKYLNITSMINNKLLLKNLKNSNIEEYLALHRVKFYLFYKEDSHFKQKYGRDFNYENCRDSIIEEVKNLICEDEELRNIINDSNKSLDELKISIGIYLIQIILLLSLVISLCILLHNIHVEFGMLKAITTLISLIFILFCIIICFKIVVKVESYSSKNNYTEKERRFDETV